MFENWESEVLQMGGFVVLTVFLRQKGSPESNSSKAPRTSTRSPTRPGRARPARCDAADWP